MSVFTRLLSGYPGVFGRRVHATRLPPKRGSRAQRCLACCCRCLASPWGATRRTRLPCGAGSRVLWPAADERSSVNKQNGKEIFGNFFTNSPEIRQNVRGRENVWKFSQTVRRSGRVRSTESVFEPRTGGGNSGKSFQKKRPGISPDFWTGG